MLQHSSESNIEVIGVYGAARKLLVDTVGNMTPITVAGFHTVKYISIVVPKAELYYDALCAAQRLHMEGFYPLLFYPEWEPDQLTLVVIWDPDIIRCAYDSMPCFYCTNMCRSSDLCKVCESIRIWEKSIKLPGNVAMNIGKSVPAVVTEQSKSVTPVINVPTARHMGEQGYLCIDKSNFVSFMLYRISHHLSVWNSLDSHSLELVPNVYTNKYIYVTIPEKFIQDKELTRRLVCEMENKGYTCGPVKLVTGTVALFICWDFSVCTLFPRMTPCTLDCGSTRSLQSSCYCTQYDAWLANWDQAIFYMIFA